MNLPGLPFFAGERGPSEVPLLSVPCIHHVARFLACLVQQVAQEGIGKGKVDEDAQQIHDGGYERR